MTQTGPADPPGNTPPTPAGPPPTTPPPPRVPPVAKPRPDVPAPPASEPIIGLELRVGKRLLWVGGAYYPLQNVARVYTSTLRPRRKDATIRFFKRLLFLLLGAAFLALVGSTVERSGENVGSQITVLVAVAGGAALIYFVADLLTVLSAPTHFVLAVDTNGLSTAVVTSPEPAQLRRLAQQIADAIENPEAEFTMRVESILYSPKNYYFGDNVNMYGNGNVGMAS
ncbi:DUF6232 family protein [Streptomyces sp. NPDC058045]|uniref:DUF6232 family protein n=1 Tax=Streptomyces sp. NPDC058045 TaxID=3346311 RepID=UPI0036EE74AD